MTVNCLPPRSIVSLRSCPGVPPEHGPHLSHGRPANRNAIDCDQMIARLHADFRHRRLSLEVRDAEDRVPAVVLRAQDESDDIKVGKVEHTAKLEVDRRSGRSRVRLGS